MEFKKNQIVELYIDDIGNEGEGIGHIDGYALFLKDAVIGDKVRAKIIKTKKNYGFARVEEVIEASKDRVSPRCSKARQCGGCTLQHLAYEKQLEYKFNKVKNCLERIGGLENIEEKIEELSKEKTSNKPSSSGVIVKGIDNCLVKLSKCCNPVPGDEIVGYITKGRGVSVHRKDCKNVKDLFSEENRMIDVAWYTDKPSSYNVDIAVFSNDRDGLLADIISTVAGEKTPMMSVTSKVSKERIVLTELTIEVNDVAQLNSVIKALRKIDSVYEVKRNK